ncbi:MAG: aminopeptidase [Candidatus Micrarchaeota archaeon]
MMTSVQEIADIVIEKCMAMKRSEKVLIIYDKTTDEIASALHISAELRSDDVMMIKIKPTGEHGAEPPAVVAKAMREADVVICPTKYSLTHTSARKLASKRGVRVVTMPGITNEMFLRAVNVDYDEVTELNGKIAKLMREAKAVRITSSSGTDFHFKNEGARTIEDDTGIFRTKGIYGNLPAGEVFTAPLEKTGAGVIVIDQMGGECAPKTKALVRNGAVQDIEGDPAFRKKMWKHKNARMIAEFGIGTNPKAALTGNVLEDEKVKGTCHVAFGSNFDFGGKIRASVHWDAIIIAPTIWFDEKKIMESGEFLI